MISSVFNIILSDARGLIRESLQPEDQCKKGPRGNQLVEVESDKVRVVSRSDITVEHALGVPPGVGLISEKMQRQADHPLADQRIGRIDLAGGNTDERLRKR